MNIKKYNAYYLILILIILAIIILLVYKNYKKTNNSNYNSQILNLLDKLKKKIKNGNGEARDLASVESAIIRIKNGFSKNANPNTSVLFSAIGIRDLGVIASSKSINLNNSDRNIIKNEILKLSSKIYEKTKEL